MTVITGALVAIGFTAAAASFIASTAISIGLSALARALAGKPKIQKANLSVKGQLGRGADVPQTFILGNYATAGTLTYANTSQGGKHPDGWMTWVITLSDLPVGGLNGIWVNGAKRDLFSTGINAWDVDGFKYPRDGSYHLKAKFYDGTQTTADSFLVSNASSPERPWDNSAVGKGKAYMIMRAWAESKTFPNGFPTFLFEVEGIALYNPAKDSSVGGSGSHRWADPTTWEGSENPAVQLYNILRGIRYEGEWLYGLQDVTEAQLPVGHWIGQINKCAATIQGADGPEPLFRSSAEIPVSAEIHEVIEALLDACNGRLSDAGGIYKLFAGAPAAPVMSFTDDDIISTSDQSFTPFLGLADTVNGVTAKYPSPAAGWQVETAPPLYRPDYEAEDGGRRLLVDVNLDFVPYAEQAQRLMQAALNEARRARRHTFTMPPEYWQLEPGDTVAWTSERNGYVDKWFRVDGIVDGPDADVVLDLTEVDPADYVFDTVEDFTPPTPPSTEPQPEIPLEVDGFMVYPHELSDAGGIDRRPAILVAWDTDLLDIRAIKFQVRVKATEELIPPVQTDDVDEGELVVEEGVLPATEYEVRAQLIPNSPRESNWTIWRSVTTPDIRFGYGDLAQTIEDDINAAKNTASNAASTAQDADQKATSVRQDHDALVQGFVGNLADAFDGVDADINTATTNLKSQLEGPGGSIKAAQDAAQAASNLAGSKGKVIVQNSAPTGANRAAENLWINTTGGKNTPNRWNDTANAWQPVTDKVATDAAQAASDAMDKASDVESDLSQNYYTKAGTAGAIAAADLTLNTSFNDLSGEITDIKALDLDGTTAFGTLLTQLDVSAGGTSATITQQGMAISDLEGNASASYVFRAGTGGSSAGMELVAWDNATGGGSVIKLDAQDVIATGTLTSSMMVVTDTSGNIAPDRPWTQGDFQGWDVVGGNSVTIVRKNPNSSAGVVSGIPSPYAVRMNHNTSTTTRLLSDKIPVAEGDEFVFEVQYAVGGSSPKLRDVQLGLRWYDGNGDFISSEYTRSPGSTTHVYATFSAETVAPAGSASVEFWIRGFSHASHSGDLYIAAPSVTKKRSGATLITPSSIYTEQLASESVTTENLAAGAAKVSNIEIDNQLVISAKRGAFVMGKPSAYDQSSDGIYMGRTEEPSNVTGFGFAVQKTAPSGLKQTLSATYDNGLRITNANFYRDLEANPIETVELSSRTYNLPSGAQTISLTLQGAGAGGGGGSRDGRGGDGGAGGQTKVALRDGTAVIKTWVAAGGAIGRGARHPDNDNSGGGGGWKGESSAFGTGGSGGNQRPGYDATGQGAGGGGGSSRGYNWHLGKGGRGGEAGDLVSVSEYDVSALSNPNLVITIGAAGEKGAGAGGDNGGLGSPGRVNTTIVEQKPFAADVIPLEPSAWGTMSSAGPFPSQGAGMWFLHTLGDAWRIDIGYISINNSGQDLHLTSQSQAVFVSSKTPTVVTKQGITHTISWQFFKMGP